MEDEFGIAPLAVYGTFTPTIGTQDRLLFWFTDPAFKLPLRSKAIFAFFADEDDTQGSVFRAREQSEELGLLVEKLSKVQGIETVAITRSMLIIMGSSKEFDRISGEVRSMMSELFGSFDFEQIPHDEIGGTCSLVMLAEMKHQVS